MSDKQIYKQIIEQEPYCQLCGSTYFLQVHHIYYRSQLGLTVPKNLIRLCDRCHRLVHSNKRKYQTMLLELQYKKYGEFKKSEVVGHKNYIKSNPTND